MTKKFGVKNFLHIPMLHVVHFSPLLYDFQSDSFVIEESQRSKSTLYLTAKLDRKRAKNEIA